MSLFEVPGWSVPSAPLAQVSTSKKRKRPASAHNTDDVDEAQRISAAQKNIEKLMKSLGAGMATLDEEGSARPNKKMREGKGKEKKLSAVDHGKGREGKKGKKAEQAGKERKADSQPSPNTKKKNEGKQVPAPREQSQESPHESPAKDKKQKQKRKEQRREAFNAPPGSESVHENDVSTPKPQVAKSTAKAQKEGEQGLTALQASMMKKLDGARFRWINEMLYKSDSGKARELMSQDPAVFSEYHTGFRNQVESWPTNPVSHYISVLSSYPAKTVIADLGCGDAALARALVPKGMSVLSFDLVSDGAYVVEADICSHIPLPGSEHSPDASQHEGEGQVIDVVVCALSLMGTNWPGCIREAWRILRPGGELRIAEVTSRFSDVEEFVSFVASFGFKSKAKDERNTHFTLFEFKKVPRKAKSEKDWKKLMSRGDLLKPCEYKRR